MPWTRDQIRVAAIAARHADWTDQQRRMVLRTFGSRAVLSGNVTSKSPRLRQDDFEIYMAIAESDAGGQLPRYAPGHWSRKAGDATQRQRSTIQSLAADLIASGVLAPEGSDRSPSLAGVIAKATGGLAASIDELGRINDAAIASKVIDALKSMRRRGRRPAHQSPQPDWEGVPL